MLEFQTAFLTKDNDGSTWNIGANYSSINGKFILPVTDRIFVKKLVFLVADTATDRDKYGNLTLTNGFTVRIERVKGTGVEPIKTLFGTDILKLKSLKDFMRAGFKVEHSPPTGTYADFKATSFTYQFPEKTPLELAGFTQNQQLVVIAADDFSSYSSGSNSVFAEYYQERP